MPTFVPVGGFRIVYEYADRLSKRGHVVTIYYPLLVPMLTYRRPYYLRYIKNMLISKSMGNWFKFENKVYHKIIPAINNKYIDDADVVIATAVPTAYEVNILEQTKGNKYYLIQHYEIWDGIGVEAANNSYKLGLNNIVIAEWLINKLKEIGADVHGCVPNAIDISKYYILNAIAKRNKYELLSIYHEAQFKGAEDMLEAFNIVKKQCPQIKVTLFSVYRKPKWLPNWINYIVNPTQEDIVKIYNRASIFISTSILEGFGLPGLEALACGCALVTTDSLGVREYAKEGITALMSEPQKPKKIADNILYLINNQDKRHELALNGHNYVLDKFTWEVSFNKFIRLLNIS